MAERIENSGAVSWAVASLKGGVSKRHIKSPL